MPVLEVEARQRFNTSDVGQAFPWLSPAMARRQVADEALNTGSNSANADDADGDTGMYNNVFYVWQTEKSGFNDMFAKKREYAALRELWKLAADYFMDVTGGDRIFSAKPRSMHPALSAWATVHRDCVFHSTHSHGENVMSGVYYVRVPDNGGRITFEDPRGPFPPFRNTIAINTRPGDIVFFPTYIPHQVTPTVGKTERVSIAVNFLTRGDPERPQADGIAAIPAPFLVWPLPRPIIARRAQHAAQ
jgi:hypothetical protein